MFVELLLALLAGVACGLVTGVTPGVHINLVALLLLNAAPFLLLHVQPITIACFIVAMAVTHSFLDVVPSVFLGAPDSEAMAMLPTHRLLLQGKAIDAVKLTITGSLFGLLLATLLLPLLFPLVRHGYPLIQKWIGHILLAAMLYLILKDRQRWLNLLVFLLSGVLGLVLFSLPVKDPLFPLLSGLFGMSSLLISLRETTAIPPQSDVEGMAVGGRLMASAAVAGTAAGSLTSFLPGLGPAQGAVLVSAVVRRLGDTGYLIMVGALGTVNFVISLVCLAALEKARNGAVLTILKVMEVEPAGIAMLALAGVVAGGLAAWLALWLARAFSRLFAVVSYRAVAVGVMAFVTCLVGVFSGWLGLLVLAVSTSVGLVAGLSGCARSHAMGCLILPVMLYFLL
jgi:putative membrane protein